MKYLLYFSLLLITPSSFAQLNDSIIRDLKGGRIANDSSYVYWLPYQKGNKYLFVQGANSSFSHKDELSFDFKMKSGSEICAARAGTIIEAKSDSDIGGLKEEFLNEKHHIYPFMQNIYKICVILLIFGNFSPHWNLRNFLRELGNFPDDWESQVPNFAIFVHCCHHDIYHGSIL